MTTRHEVRLATAHEQAHWYNDRGKNTPIWSQWAVFADGYIDGKLYDSEDEARAVLSKRSIR